MNDTNVCFLSLLILYINHISQLTPLRERLFGNFGNVIIGFEVGVQAWFGLHVRSLIGLAICSFL